MIMKKKTNFEQRSRRVKKKMFIRLKNQLRNQRSYFGGLFCTYDVISEGTSWADIRFVSKIHKNRFYNAVIDTAAYSYKEKLESLSWSAAEEFFKSKAPEHLKNCFYDDANETSDPKLFDKIFSLCFGGTKRTALYRWQNDWIAEQAKKGAHPVKPHYKLDFKYRYGVGLHIVVDAPAITRQVIVDAIEAFYEAGEVDFSIDFELSFTQEQLKAVRSANAVSDNLATWAGPLKEEVKAQDEKGLLEEMLSPSSGQKEVKVL